MGTVREDSLGVYLTSVLKEKAGKWFADGIRELEVTFKVGKDGRVVRPRVLQAPSVEVERSVEKALLEAPVWEERFRGERLRGILRLEEKDGQVLLYGENSRGRAFEASAELVQREQHG